VDQGLLGSTHRQIVLVGSAGQGDRPSGCLRRRKRDVDARQLLLGIAREAGGNLQVSLRRGTRVIPAVALASHEAQVV
jgi:hypothetical protein